jgi:hypothetical protein
MTTKERYELMRGNEGKRTKDLRLPSYIALAVIAVAVASQGIMEAYLTLLITCLVVIVFLIGEKR